eukprot:2949220-Pyramimonas_sp.AAC.1
MVVRVVRPVSLPSACSVQFRRAETTLRECSLTAASEIGDARRHPSDFSPPRIARLYPQSASHLPSIARLYPQSASHLLR